MDYSSESESESIVQMEEAAPLDMGDSEEDESTPATAAAAAASGPLPILQSWFHWGAPQQLDDALGWRRASLSVATPQGKAALKRRIAWFSANSSASGASGVTRTTSYASDTTLTFPVTADNLPLGDGWPPRGHVFRTCYIMVSEKQLHDLLIRGDLRNSPFGEKKKHRHDEQLALRLGAYGAIPLVYRGMWADNCWGFSKSKAEAATFTEGNPSRTTRVSSLPCVRRVYHVFEALPPPSTSTHLLPSPSFRLDKLGSLRPAIVFPSGHRDHVANSLCSHDLNYTTYWNDREQAMTIESGISVVFPWMWSIPPPPSSRRPSITPPASATSSATSKTTLELWGDVPRVLRQSVLYPMFNPQELEELRCALYEHQSAKELVTEIRHIQLQPVGTLHLKHCCGCCGRISIAKRCNACQRSMLVPRQRQPAFAKFSILIADVTLQSWRRQRMFASSRWSAPHELVVTLHQDSVVTHFEYTGIYSFRVDYGTIPTTTRQQQQERPNSLPTHQFIGRSNIPRFHIWRARSGISEHFFRSGPTWTIVVDPNGEYGGATPQITWSIDEYDLRNVPSPWPDAATTTTPQDSSAPPERRFVCSNLNESSLWTKPIVIGESKHSQPPAAAATAVAAKHDVEMQQEEESGVDSDVDDEELDEYNNVELEDDSDNGANDQEEQKEAAEESDDAAGSPMKKQRRA